ncbi:hypothetical protein ACFOLF_37100 [Paenibacillus sepulcri]|uniref:Uncharacterized protein n=1 Tax=Paenibacillus sepulcri TaxID=359917 RepID=A0ABS7BXL3_9BACL|nr:hypothetical protein [Paenibacillus sepulcri]
MSQEPTFVSTIVHEDPDEPDDVIFYEVWNCSREYFETVIETREYRDELIKAASEFILDRPLSWLEPVGEWGSQLTKPKGIEM